ncbi:MAG: arginyltransferase [Paracoccaceae bacterium]|nr:arginyltransferase [Paracoccaceae bacterium]
MRHTLPIAPQFYVTAPQPCPYLNGRQERKLFTSLQGDDAQRLNDTLSQQGFRRSQNVLYRPSCADCSACLSARVDLSKFELSKSQKRVSKRNKDLIRKANSPWATEDQYELFRKYLNARHATGGMADMDVFEFAAMIEETPIRTRVVEYTIGNALAAVSLTDLIEDGLSMVYSFYDPMVAARSIGTYLILDHIALAKEAKLSYLYLGYWVPGSKKMGYKARFSGLEIYFQGKWQSLSNPTEFNADLHPLNTEPISEQVANLTLPDSKPVRG